MRIGDNFPPLYPQNPAPVHDSNPEQQAQRLSNPAQQPRKGSQDVTVDISPKAWAAYKQGEARPSGGHSAAEALSAQECKTCGSRTYKDVSNDPSVSFQTPTHISPGQSAAVVSAHESEHVANERLNAERDGREIINQTVTLHTSICPECKRVYVSGGTTKTMSMGSDNLPMYA